MEFDAKTIALIAGAAVVVFFPQIMEFLKGLKTQAPAQQPASTTKSRTVGSEPSDWVVDLLALKKVLDANGQTDASNLVAQAATKIIGAPPTPPRNGGARK